MGGRQAFWEIPHPEIARCGSQICGRIPPSENRGWGTQRVALGEEFGAKRSYKNRTLEKRQRCGTQKPLCGKGLEMACELVMGER